MKSLKFNSELNNFYILQLGQFISELGSRITSFALIIWLYEKSGSVLSTSALTICWLLPSVLLSFLAGSIIDKRNKKRVLLICDSLGAICSIFTLVLIFYNKLYVPYLYMINFMLGLVNAFQDPASSVAISLIVPREHYMKTSGVRSFASSCITIFAPAIAASFYALFGMKLVIIIDLWTFVFAFISLLIFVHIPNDIINRENNSSFIENCKSGIFYIITRKDIFHLILFMAFVNLIAAIYNSNLTPMILARNGNNKFQLGVVSSTVGIAGIVGSILVSIWKEPKKRVPVILNTMTFSFLICNTTLGIGRNYYIWTISIFLGNCLIPFLTANVEYLMRTKIPLDMQGRVFSARNTLQYITIPIGYLGGGLMTDKLLEPFMKSSLQLKYFFSVIVGSGKGSGSALLYVFIGLAGFLGCIFFRYDNHMKTLD